MELIKTSIMPVKLLESTKIIDLGIVCDCGCNGVQCGCNANSSMNLEEIINPVVKY